MTGPQLDVERLRILVEHTNDLLYSFTPDGRIESMHGPVERVSGYQVGDLLGRPVFDLVDPQDLAIARKHHMDKVEGRADSSLYEIRLRHKDGRVVWCEVSSRAVRTGGRLTAIHGILRDVSQRKAHDEVVAASEVRFRDLWENANDILYTHDLTGRFTDVNRAALETYGYTRTEFLAMSIKDIVEPADLPVAQSHLRAKLEGREERTPPYELRTRAKDGTTVWAEVSTRIVSSDGRPSAVHGIVRNVTKRKAEEARINFVQDMALELGRAKDFTATLQATLDRVCVATGWVYGEAWVPDAEGLLTCSSAWHGGKSGFEKFRSLSSKMRFDPTEGLAGALRQAKRPIWREDLSKETLMKRAAAAQAAGLATLVGIPVLDDGQTVADLVFMHTNWRPGDERWIAALEAVANQLSAVLALRRREDQLRRQARLFTAQLRANPFPAVASDQHGNLLWANQRFLELAGVSLKDGFRFGLDRVRFLDMVDQPARLNEFASHMCETADQQIPVAGKVFQRLDNSLRDEEGPLGHVWYFRDITEMVVARSKSGAN